ncbi:hypothetical protein HY024_04750 [Candidatus Curtissbacteria bacterium]|nr:hypothetical protein [Candidatus Curtissbacteria bacterium]
MTNPTELTSSENPSAETTKQATNNFFSRWASEISIVGGIITTGAGSFTTGIMMGRIPTNLSLAEGGATAVVAFATSMQVLVRARKGQ